MPAAEEEGVEERTLAKVLKGPDQPTAAEIEQHEAQGHVPYRKWCPQCVCAWGRTATPEGSTRRRRATNGAPRLCLL
eukprot:3111667-Amphidinium_carterae.1